jgi:hypothetical protein
MARSKLVSALSAIAAFLLVVSGALAAVLISGGSNDSTPPAAAVATRTPEATSTPAPTPDIIPERLRARFEALPERLRQQARTQLERGQLSIDQVEELIRLHEARNPGVYVGSVVESSVDSLRMRMYTTGEEIEVDIDARTEVLRDGHSIKPSDLVPDELVLVLTTNNGETASSVRALGVGLP